MSGSRGRLHGAPREHGHRRGPFVLNVRSLRARPGTRHEVHLAGSISEMFVSEARVPEDAEVRFDGWVESTRGGVTVAGVATAPWVGVCRRCLEPASGVLSAEIRELCRDPHDLDVAGWGDGGDDDEPYAVGRDDLDVEPILRDACILELPLAPLCSDTCRGLCPTCGANRNRDECSCDPPIDPRWSALAGRAGGAASQVGDEERAENEGEAGQAEQEGE